ncbi:hypothetical protein [Sorangium sp. So ce1151]|uniref:hypothetical protein n=1 Tax=Sorangium sp. So ce1151 TaxID=3133332 RepID=UPI003F622749
MIGVEGKRAIIRRLVVRGAGLDPIAARLSAEALLAAADVHPPSLPPAAILAIRRLPDPRPGVLALDRGGLRPPRGWAEALAASLDTMVRRADRPGSGTVGAEAEAVLFADRSDLLACLASDFLRGEVGARWWWSSLLPDASAARAAVTAWIAAPEHVPGALHLLAERREAMPFVQALAREEIRALARAVAERCGAAALLAAIAPVAAGTGVPGLPAAIASGAANARSARVAVMQGEAAREPWAAWAPEACSSALDSAPRALLGVALALHRTPVVARSMAFAEAVRRWDERTPGGEADLGGAVERAPASGPGLEAGATWAEEDTPRAPRAQGDAPHGTRGAAGLSQGDEGSSMTPRPREPTPSPALSLIGVLARPEASSAHAGPRPTGPFSLMPAAPLSARSAAPHASPPSAPPLPPAARDAHARPRTSLGENGSSAWLGLAPPAAPRVLPGQAPPIAGPIDPPAQEDPPERPPRIWGAPVATRFGGVFFVVNLGLYLGLYGDFSTPLEPGIELPIWDFVALVGRDLLGEAAQEPDPIWRLLASLAGRPEHEPPGARFAPPDAWRAPRAWLKPFPGGRAWTWAAGAGRLAIVHPAGFTAVDVAAEADAAAQAWREAGAYGDDIQLAEGACAPLGRGARPLDRWLEWLLPYVRARLAQALKPEAGQEPGALLCAVPGRVYVTTTHLDVGMSLGHLPIEVRLAGLDRDPGWLPTAGRYVAFHFS